MSGGSALCREAEPIPEATDNAARQVVDAAYRVHKKLGPGLLENVYEICLVHELVNRGLRVKTQVSQPIEYDGVKLDAGLRLDMVVADCVVVELKSVDRLAPVHQAQLLSYLRLSGHRLGLLINFKVPIIKEGIKRIAL
jgi:GxxExxY protein